MADRLAVSFASAADFEEWLGREHSQSDGIWLKIAKKDSGVPSVSYAEALDVALCFGWIDGQKAAHDGTYWLQRFTPRKARSRWSKINTGHAERLIESGRMQPAGLAEVERAKADGRWDAAYEPQRTATVPQDLQAALDADPSAKEFFATLDSRNRYAILHRLGATKTPSARAARIEKYVTMLHEHKVIYP
ncbi:MAG TPA: YdeI/OmpD-associated family protein [Streptosporangiaceae bacterium]|nr:YdeI/OmpD-associated family protein [Streptosporangiaceae bacterium]